MMLKILIYATPESKGHHYTYFSYIINSLLVETEKYDVVAVLSEPCVDVKCKQRYIEGLNWGTKSFLEYFRLMNKFRKIVKEEAPDCIHIQCGDNFYRFFGFGLGFLNNYNSIITFHHMKRSVLRDISLHRIFNRIKNGVVHTVSLKDMLLSMRINNVVHIEYPQFYESTSIDKNNAKLKLGIKNSEPVLLALGSTREDKGLDILLDALNFVNRPFHLLVAGSVSSYDENFINEKSNDYNPNVTLLLHFLNDEEFNLCLNAADYIVLPYRKCFDGASGPLGEGVAREKGIIGPNHGSLGQIIIDNHLGYTFEAENIDSLAKTINQALLNGIVIDNKYLEYKRSLSPEIFIMRYKLLFDKVS